MAHYRSTRPCWVLMTALTLPWVFCGCTGFKVLPVLGQTAEVPPTVDPQNRVELPPSNPNTAVTAVQDFLERTQAYDLQKVEAIPKTVSTAEVALQPTLPIRNEPIVAPSPFDGLPVSVSDTQRAPNRQVTLARVPSAIVAAALPVIESVSIRVVKQPGHTETTTEKLNTANQPLDMGVAAVTPRLADELIDQLEARAEESADFVTEWSLRLTQLALDHADDARRVSPTLPAEQRSVLSAFLELAVAVRSAVLDPWLGVHDPLERMDQLRNLLMDRTDPSVRSIALCTKVVTYGVYDEMAADRFVAGRSVPTIIYSEIANLQSELSEDARFVTRLRTRIELLTVDGQSVWYHEEPEIVDRCRQRRKDFFIAQRVTFPPTLPAGDYVLKVYAEDKLSGRAGETTYPLSIQSALTVASGK